MQHLGSLSEDKKSLKENECGRLKGYLSEWKKPSIPLLLAILVDLLEIPSTSSLFFQG